MANGLRAKLSKLRHDRKINEEEYKELIKKLDGHDRVLLENTEMICPNCGAIVKKTEYREPS